ncbi:MAG TPA: SAM-dependent chlorinase/fluorinase [Pyrinomonadaceae bacterium]|jgi:S-adenosylmethionine hydrolase|nr:SAM-dependent chlorinase/fluorinase [Pyrinomonadaceae bacterium]
MLITLLTDFGTADYFVGAMKGVILSINAGARVLDLTHEIAAHDIQAGAFNLLAVYKEFPAATIHVAVVDPGVGSARRPILVTGGGQFFVGPDNGLFSYIYERETDRRVFHLTRAKYFRHPVSETFHGRDVFAPVAGALSLGTRADELGDEITDYQKLAPLAPAMTASGEMQASILHIDRFGNCVTNLTREDLTEQMIAQGARLLINGETISTFRRFYADSASEEQTLFAVWGSAGFLEIVAFRASAAKTLNAERGQSIRVQSHES